MLGESMIRRRQRELANPTVNEYRQRILRELAIPVFIGSTSSLIGTGITAGAGQGLTTGAMVGGIAGLGMAGAGRLACYIGQKCKECDDARDIEFGRLRQHNPLQQAASGASKD